MVLEQSSSANRRRHLRPFILGWFFFSGLAALIYQVLWARQLELAFGSTLPAVSIILSVFMAGLALGSLFLGRLADRYRHPLRLYAYLELGISIYACLTPWIFQGLFQLQLYWGKYSATGVSGFSPMNLLFSALVLLFPTTLMGGTLPVMTKFIVSRYDELGTQVGRLYFINTLGAAAGSVLAGFLMMAALGLLASTYVAAGINLTIGILAFLFQRAWLLPSQVPTPPEGVAPSISVEWPSARWLKRLILPVYGLAGFAALALEVLLTRALVLVLGTSVYAFSLMLSAILVGIAVGSLLVARLIDNRKNLWWWFAFIEVGIGLAIIALTAFLGQAPIIMLPIFLAYNQTFWALQLAQFLLLFMAMLAPTILMGAAFPIVSKLYARELERLGHAVGRVYAVNTFGAIIGPLVAGFVLVPLMGIQTSLLAVASIYLILGALFLALSPTHRPALRPLAVGSVSVVVILGILLTPSWNRNLMTSGVYYHPRFFSGPSPVASLKQYAQGVKLLYYREGQLGIVSVIEASQNTRVLAINGKPEASSHVDLSTQLLVGHIPLLLHEKPRKVMMVGLGSAITLGAILQHSELERVDAIEIEPAVIEAAAFFSEANNEALKDPRLRLIVGDARNRVLTSSEKYDVIATEPPNPWVSGATALFSREMFELYKARLNEGGLVSQWIHLYSISSDDLRAIVNTFISVFPYTTIWQDYTRPDIQLIGSLKPIRIDFARFQEKLGEDRVQKSLARIGAADPYVLLSYFLMDETSARAFSQGARLNTDNHPRLEFTTPKYLYTFTFGTNMEAMLPFLSSPVKLLNRGVNTEIENRLETYASFRKYVMQGEVFQEQYQWAKAVPAWEEALRLIPGNAAVTELLVEGYEYLGTELASQGQLQQSVDTYKKAMDLAPNRASVYKAIAVVAETAGMLEEATAHLVRASEIAPNDAEVYSNLGNIYLAKGDFANAAKLFSRSLEISPAYATAHKGRGDALLNMGQYEKAIAAYSEAIRLNPKFSRFYVARARAYAQTTNYRRAIGDSTMAVQLEPSFPSGYENRGIAYLNSGNYSRAIKDFSQAIQLKPSPYLHDNRALAYIYQKRYEAALEDLKRAVELDDSYALPYYRLGYVYQQMGNKREALAQYERFLTLAVDSELGATARSAIEKLKASN